MQDFSIEMAAERIVDGRTREYFREVHSSYVNGNYRSATVMLWSVVVADLVFKLEELDAMYADPAAVAILQAVTQAQRDVPNSPQWELQLLEEVKQRTSLLEVAEYEGLVALQRQRHLSAHPILTGTRELSSPTREMTRANIRAALDAVLTKPALMSRKILDTLLEDLERLRDRELGGDEVEKFVVAKYFRHMLPRVEDLVFKSLWNLVFRKTDPRCEQNRKINRVALEILFSRKPERCIALIEADQRHYGDVTSDGTCGFHLVAFLARQQRAFASLPEQAKVIVRAAGATDPDLRAISWFLAGSLEEHLNSLLDAVERERFQFRGGPLSVLRQRAEDEGPAALALVDKLAVLLYCSSKNYNEADKRFDSMIRPWLERLSTENMLLLLARVEGNDQACGRSRADTDHKLVKLAAERILGKDFEFAKYPNFVQSISRS